MGTLQSGAVLRGCLAHLQAPPASSSPARLCACPLPGQPSVSLICRPRAMKASGWCRIGGCSSCDIHLSGGPISFILSCGSATLVQCSPSPVPRNLPEETSPNPCFLPLPSAPPIHRSGKQDNKQHVSETWVQTPECWVNLGRAHPLSAC